MKQAKTYNKILNGLNNKINNNRHYYIPICTFKYPIRSTFELEILGHGERIKAFIIFQSFKFHTVEPSEFIFLDRYSRLINQDKDFSIQYTYK